MALYGMIAYPIHSGAWAANSLESAIKYLVLSAVASATMLFGMALIYAATGSLGFLDIAVSTGALFYLGLLIAVRRRRRSNCRLVPFHLWTARCVSGRSATGSGLSCDTWQGRGSGVRDSAV